MRFLTVSRKLTDTDAYLCIDVQEIEIFYRRRDFFYGIQGKDIKENWMFFYLLRCIYLRDIKSKGFSSSHSCLDRPKETTILRSKGDYVLRPARYCLELHNYAMITRNAGDVNGDRAVNTTFVVAQNATAARAAGYGDADYSLI